MLLQDSRRDARLAPDGELVLLADQDRALWDAREIDEGLRMLERARGAPAARAYQLQAAIAAGHAQGVGPGDASRRPTRRCCSSTARRSPGSTTPSPSRSPATSSEGLALDRRASTGSTTTATTTRPGPTSSGASAARRGARRLRRALELTDDGPERRFLERRLGEIAVDAPE